MLKLKKICALMCTIALAATAIVMPITNAYATATSLSYGLADGITAAGGDDFDGYYTNVVVTVDGLFTSKDDYTLTSSGTLEFYVTKGALLQGVNVKAIASNGGLYGFVNKADFSSLATVTAIEGNDKYDLLSVNYYGADAYLTRTGKMFEIQLNYKDVPASASELPTLEIIPKPDSSRVTPCDKSLVAGSDIVKFTGTDYIYEVAAGTNKVTATSTGTSETIPTAADATPVYDGTAWPAAAVTATAIADSEGNYTFEGVSADDTAVAYGVGIKADGVERNKVIWKVTVGEVTKGHEMTLKSPVSGEGTAKVGLAIQGLTAADNAEVSVAFGN